MGSFFFALFGIIWLCIVFGNESRNNSRYQAEVDETKSRSNKWHTRVNKGPLNNYQFNQKLRNDYEFCCKVIDECNSVIDSIPEMGGIKLGNPTNHDTSTVIEMMYNARSGDVSIMWFTGYIELYQLTKGFQRKPSIEGCQALINWYQEELRKNGYTNATIRPINRSGFVIGWYFTDGAASYDMIKHRLFIN